jgi:ribosomal protein L37AE/L43A
MILIQRKRCHACRKLSYSLSQTGAWLCPHCGRDLAAQPLEPVETSVAAVLPLAPVIPERYQLN